MASEKILNEKKQIVSEIVDSIKNSESVILFQYQGLTVAEMSDLRNKLNEIDSTVKIYKNTLLKRALDELNLNMDEFLDGPNAMLFGKELLEPIKIISEYAKDHDKLNIRVGIISGDVAGLDVIREYATIPSRDGLLTMLAGGMMQYVRDLAIGLNLYSEQIGGSVPSEDTPKATEEVVEEVTEVENTETVEAPVEETSVEETTEEAVESQEESTENANESTEETTEKTEEVTENA